MGRRFFRNTARRVVALLAGVVGGAPADPKAVAAAEFVVGELQRLSDSGIYRSLTLARVVAAAHAEGVYHATTRLVLDLASPHFASKNATERVDVIAMTRPADGARSFAIDAFPRMDAAALEAFQAEAIERRRADRAAAFDRIVAEDTDDDDAPDSRIMLEALTSRLVDDLADAALRPDRRDRARAILADRARDFELYLLSGLAPMDTATLAAVARDDAELPERRALAQRLYDDRAAFDRPLPP